MNQKGGARVGAGRKKTFRKTWQVRLNAQEHAQLKKLGGSQWLQNFLQRKEMKTKLLIKKVADSAIFPKQGSQEAACFDLFVSQDTVLKPFEGTLVSSGIAFGIPEGHCVKIYLRSSMCKRGILGSTGIVDSDYTGEVKVQAMNVTDKPILVKAGERLGQAMLVKLTETEIEEADQLRKTERGENGWGSTGK